MIAPNIDDRARALHADAIVIDGLDVSLHDERHWQAMKAGGVTAANVTITVADDFKSTCQLIADLNERIEAHGDLVCAVRTVDDIHAAKREGRVGLIFGFQNASPLEGDLRFVRIFRDLGIRIFQPVWNASNLLGDSCFEPRNAGLTDFGKAVAGELNRQRMLVDLSHCDFRTAMDAIALSEQPVAMTHANVRALSQAVRNKEDEVIDALAAKGGVMGIAALAHFVSNDWREATLARYCDHIDYVVKLVGINHVGIGLDLTENLPASALQPPSWGGVVASAGDVSPYLKAGLYPFPYARDLESAAKLPGVTRELLVREYSESDIEKVLGGNWLRILTSVWDG